MLPAPALSVPDPVLLNRLRTHRDALHPRLRVVPEPVPIRHPAPTPLPLPPNQQELRQRVREVLEILDGRRPIGQLDELVPADQALLLLEWAKRAHAPRRLRSLHPYRTTATAIDLCALVDSGRRVRAMVGRLEVEENRWRFTLLRLI
jgi:hypothetical protein